MDIGFPATDWQCKSALHIRVAIRPKFWFDSHSGRRCIARREVEPPV